MPKKRTLAAHRSPGVGEREGAAGAAIMSGMGKKEATNPFYVALLPVGAVFAMTACAYAVMAVRALDVRRGESSGLMTLLQEHGVAILVVELAVLGVLCLAAIASDEYWERRHAARQARQLPRLPDPPS